MTTRRRPKQEAGSFNAASALDDLRQLIAKVDTFAHVTENRFDELPWPTDDDDESSRLREDVAQMIGATAEAARAALKASSQLASELVKHRAEE